MADIETKVEGGVKEERIIRVRDTRITQLAVGMLVGVSAFLLPLPINYIPRAALDGLLLCIALISLKGNITIDRLKLLIKSQSAFPVNHQIRRIPVKEVHKFTLLQMIQLIIACCLGFIENTVMNILFPVMIFMMLPIRQLIIPRFFIPEHLELLDPNKVVYEDGNSPDDFIDADISSPGSYKEPGKNIVPQTGHTDVKNEGSSFSFKTSDTTDSYGSRALKFFSFKGSPV